jgi:hypothetical protein
VKTLGQRGHGCQVGERIATEHHPGADQRVRRRARPAASARGAGPWLAVSWLPGTNPAGEEALLTSVAAHVRMATDALNHDATPAERRRLSRTLPRS